MSSSTITYKGEEINCVRYTQWCIHTKSSTLDDYIEYEDFMDWAIKNPKKTYEQYLKQTTLNANNTVAAASGTKCHNEDPINSGPFDNGGYKGGDADALHTNEGSECHN